jgi:2'-5' RNA ligase
MNQVLLSKLAAEPNTPFPFGTVQAEIPESSPAAVAISSMQGEIAEEDLAGRGRDIGPPHVTLRYGIQGDDVSAIKALLMTQRPFAITLGPTSSFPTSATREVVVMIATIECLELHALHQQLGAVVDFAKLTHPYEPHVTVAYVRPEVAEKYVGNQITAGHTFVITEVVIRTQSREETIVALNG